MQGALQRAERERDKPAISPKVKDANPKVVTAHPTFHHRHLPTPTLPTELRHPLILRLLTLGQLLLLLREQQSHLKVRSLTTKPPYLNYRSGISLVDLATGVCAEGGGGAEGIGEGEEVEVTVEEDRRGARSGEEVAQAVRGEEDETSRVSQTHRHQQKEPRRLLPRVENRLDPRFPLRRQPLGQNGRPPLIHPLQR